MPTISDKLNIAQRPVTNDPNAAPAKPMTPAGVKPAVTPATTALPAMPPMPAATFETAQRQVAPEAVANPELAPAVDVAAAIKELLSPLAQQVESGPKPPAGLKPAVAGMLADDAPLVADMKPPKVSSDVIYLDDEIRINVGSVGGLYLLKRSGEQPFSI